MWTGRMVIGFGAEMGMGAGARAEVIAGVGAGVEAETGAGAGTGRGLGTGLGVRSLTGLHWGGMMVLKVRWLDVTGVWFAP